MMLLTKLLIACLKFLSLFCNFIFFNSICWFIFVPVQKRKGEKAISMPHNFAALSVFHFYFLTSHFSLHSQWESKKVKMPDVAASAPLTRDRINPSRLELRSTRTLWILDNSMPSLANEKKFNRREYNNFPWFINKRENLRSSLKSSTRIISLMRCSGLLLSTL